MKNPLYLWRALRRRMRFAIATMLLEIRHALARRTVWVDRGFLRLPYHGDGDKQEVFYHLHGATWWNTERNRLMPYIGEGSVVVDVGANLGFMTGLFSRLCKSSGRVHSFEPSPTTFFKLQEVVEANGLSNVTLHNAGCGSTRSEMELHLTQSSGNSTLRGEAAAQQGLKATQRVRIEVLDDYLSAQIERLDFVKIDTEGFENEVLQGCRRLLQQFHPVVYIELSAEYRDSSRAAIDLLKSEGYSFDREPDFDCAHMGDNFLAFPAGFQHSKTHHPSLP